MYQPMSPSVAQLVSTMSGDQISVTQSNSHICIGIRPGISKTLGYCGVLFIPTGVVLGGAALSLAVTLSASDQPSWWAIAAWAAVGLLGLLPAIAMTAILIPPLVIRSNIEISDQSVYIKEGGSAMEFPWEDIKSVRVLYKRKTERQIHVKSGVSYLRGRGGGIAIETPHGTVKLMTHWHHEVSQWLARLLSEVSGVTLFDDEKITRPVLLKPIVRGLSATMSRKESRGAMLLGLFLAILALFGVGRIALDYRDLVQWKLAVGIIESIDMEKSETQPHLVVSYRYEVQGITFENDSSRIDDLQDGRQADIAVGDRIEVRYDPDDPRESTAAWHLRLGACTDGIIIFLALAFACGLLGATPIIYAAIRKENALATHYGCPNEKE